MNMLKLKGKSNKTMRKWLSNWSYSDLEFKLVYKCKMNGIRVEFVDARYTSQKCSVCKTIDKASRNGSRYTCRHCGSRMHADTNAAINIRDNYITRVMQSGQAAVNQPYGWGATGKPETESVDKTPETTYTLPSLNEPLLIPGFPSTIFLCQESILSTDNS